MSPDAQQDEPPAHRIRIDVTFTLSRRLMWLLAGVIIGGLGTANDLLVMATSILRALLPGDPG